MTVSHPRLMFLRLLAQELVRVFQGSLDVPLLLAPLRDGDVQIVNGPFTPEGRAIPFAFVDQEGRAAQAHAAQDPVSLHAHKRLAFGAEFLPFLIVNDRTDRPWLGLFLLRELEAYRLSRARLQLVADRASADAFRPFRDEVFYRDEVRKHSFAADLLERQQTAASFRTLVAKARGADARSVLNMAGDFCAGFSGAGAVRKRDAERCKHFVACALFAETLSEGAFLTMLRADTEGTMPLLSL